MKSKKQRKLAPQPESVADFRERIAIMMRQRETGKRYSVIGGPRANVVNGVKVQ